MILLILSEVIGELLDSSGKEGDLDGCRPCVAVVTTKPCDDFLFLLLIEHRFLLFLH